MSNFRDFHVMTTKSGRAFTPLTSDDVVDVIREEVGDEVANEVKGWLEENNYEEMKFNSDFSAIEGECEAWHSFVDDLSEEIERLREQIEDNKLTKAKISVELYKIYEKMRKEL